MYQKKFIYKRDALKTEEVAKGKVKIKILCG